MLNLVEAALFKYNAMAGRGEKIPYMRGLYGEILRGDYSLEFTEYGLF
jgi:hypothetical protein